MPDTPRPAPKGNAVIPEGGRPPNNLPLELSSFVGRDREVSEVEALLSGNRLVTLTGPGGSGKTRLALRVASEALEPYEDGAWLVELAPLSDPDLVARTAASVLGVRETPGGSLLEALSDHLRPRRLLLLLDNCEHLVEPSAELADALLSSCPNLSVLATSREALRVPGEAVFAVPPLSLPDPRRPPEADGLSGYEAARLFVERAKAVKHDFSLTGENAWAVAQVCYRLDGIPLAIELAAARTRALSVEQISSRLDDSFRLLTGGGRSVLVRQRTLRAAMDWSYDLLSEKERGMLRRSSVFAGGFTIEAAEAVGEGGGVEGTEVLDLLTSLVEKSLVLFEERGGRARYRLLETVRQYASEKLEESGEAAQARSRHASWFLGLAEQAEPELKGAHQPAWLGRLEAEHDDLRAAMRFLLDHDDRETAVRLAWALWLFWYQHGHQREGYRYAGEALEGGDALHAHARAKALCVRGIMAHGLEGPEQMERLFEESVALFRATGDGSGAAIALSGVGVTALQQGDTERAKALLEESLALHRKAGEKFDVANVLVYLGTASLNQGNHERAARCFEEALATSREVGDRLSGYTSLYNLALSSRGRGDPQRAARLYAEGLELAVEAGDKANAAYCLEGLAGLMAERDELEHATRLFGASEALLETVGAPLYAHVQDRTLHEEALETLRRGLGEEAFRAARAKGREMPLREAIEYALEEPMTSAAVEGAAPELPAGLSGREAEVLRLVARGLTNARAAEVLFISPRTVNAHLSSIYRKIGSSTRAEAARFASENGLL